jgi:hypothetical protein
VMIHTMVDFNYVATLKGLSNEHEKRLQKENCLEFCHFVLVTFSLVTF